MTYALLLRFFCYMSIDTGDETYFLQLGLREGDEYFNLIRNQL